MKSYLHRIPLFLLCITFSTAETPVIDQSLELVLPPTGSKFIRWHGKIGRTYFILVSDPADHLNVWKFAPIMEGGNDEDISTQVDGTADKGFFRLQYTDVPTSDPYLADFDNDGISNSVEVEILHTNPFTPNSGVLDSDGDGLVDAWEIYWFGSLTAQSGDGDADNDGIINKYELQANTKPTEDGSTIAGASFEYGYDTEGRLLSVGGKGDSVYTYDNEGNLKTAQ